MPGIFDLLAMDGFGIIGTAVGAAAPWKAGEGLLHLDSTGGWYAEQESAGHLGEPAAG